MCAGATTRRAGHQPFTSVPAPYLARGAAAAVVLTGAHVINSTAVRPMKCGSPHVLCIRTVRRLPTGTCEGGGVAAADECGLVWAEVVGKVGTVGNSSTSRRRASKELFKSMVEGDDGEEGGG